MKVFLDDGAFVPTKAHEADAGFDLYAKEDFVVPETGKERAAFDDISVGCASHDTGVHIELPKGTCGLLVSKSGLNVKYDLTSTGLIDEGYTGSITVKLYNHSSKPYYFHKGEKISQLLILPVVKTDIEVVEELEATERGNNGFGSSGK